MPCFDTATGGGSGQSSSVISAQRTLLIIKLIHLFLNCLDDLGLGLGGRLRGRGPLGENQIEVGRSLLVGLLHAPVMVDGLLDPLLRIPGGSERLDVLPDGRAVRAILGEDLDDGLGVNNERGRMLARRRGWVVPEPLLAPGDVSLADRGVHRASDELIVDRWRPGLPGNMGRDLVPHSRHNITDATGW
jgi:hypothetical protein